MDNAATTMIGREVLDAIVPYLTEKYGNPSGIHHFGAESNAACENSKKIAKLMVNRMM